MSCQVQVSVYMTCGIFSVNQKDMDTICRPYGIVPNPMSTLNVALLSIILTIVQLTWPVESSLVLYGSELLQRPVHLRSTYCPVCGA